MHKTQKKKKVDVVDLLLTLISMEKNDAAFIRSFGKYFIVFIVF